ncbi:MAG: GNAT family N-acetyltransferase [Deltaproteobacteria bacterium]|nr:GNAT family N-acetyltransferase [Deltaproteobacteria bacterium]
MNPFKTKSAAPADFLATRIDGERIVLSPVSEEHAQDIFHEFTEDITRHMMPKPLSDMAHAYEFVDTCRKNMKAGLELVLAITKVDSGEFLGICAIHGNNDPQVPELGVWIKKSAHGKKLGKEAVRYLAEWAMKNLLFSYLIYPVDRDNIPSRKIAESLGGVVLEERVRKSMSGATLNEIVYKIEVQ